MTFVLVGESLRIALPVLQTIRSFGGKKCMLAGDKKTLGLRWSSLCNRHILIDFEDDQSSIRQINELAQTLPDAILITFDCTGIKLINRIRGSLLIESIPIPDLSTLEMFDDKWRFYEFCRAYSLCVPDTYFVGRKSEINFSLVESQLSMPFVVKPTNGSGSLGVEIIHNRQEFETKIINNPNYEFDFLIVQKYIDGVDMDISLLSVRGGLRAVSIHRPDPSVITFLANAALEEMAENICRYSAYHGVMNVDLRVENGTGKVYLIESNPRFWATLASSAGCGLNFVAESINHANATGEVRRLTSGQYHTRHPLLRPSSWRPLLREHSCSGRLLRAIMFDPFSLAQFAKKVPAMAARYVRRRQKTSVLT